MGSYSYPYIRSGVVICGFSQHSHVASVSSHITIFVCFLFAIVQFCLHNKSQDMAMYDDMSRYMSLISFEFTC